MPEHKADHEIVACTAENLKGNSLTAAVPEHKEDRDIVACTAVRLEGSSLTAAATEHKADHEIVVYTTVKLKVNSLTVVMPEHRADLEIVDCTADNVKEGFDRPYVALCGFAPAFTPKQLRTPLTRRIYRRNMLCRVMMAEG